MDRAGVGAGTALPATVNVLAARKGLDLFLQRLVVIADHPGLDKGAPVTRNVDALDFLLFLHVQVFRTDQ